MSPMNEVYVLWTDLDTYLEEARERVIIEIAGADDSKGMHQGQGKLQLITELRGLKAILKTGEAQQAEEATEIKRGTLTPIRDRVDTVLGAAEAAKMYGPVRPASGKI